MTWKGLLSCACLLTVVAVACSGDDGKKASRGEDAGAGGESVDPNAGGSSMMAAGAGEPSGGTSSGGVGGEAGQPVVPSEAGAGGTGAGGVFVGEGGAAGQGSGALTIQDLQGSWTGHLLGSYVCESGLEEIELTFDGSSVVSSWPSVEDTGTGQVVQQAGQSFTFGIFTDNPNFNQNYLAQLYVDPSGQYAIFIALAQYEGDNGVSGSADIAILQKAAATPLDAVEEDFLGDWSGTGFRLGDDFKITEQFDSSANFDVSDGLVLASFVDADGEIPSAGLEETNFAEGAWIAPRMTQTPHTLGGMFLMSDDKRMMAVALLRELDQNDGALCDLTDPFADMSVHKFALWSKTID